MSLSTSQSELKTWDISSECRSQIEQLKSTSAWLRTPSDPGQLEQYRRKYVAARDCQIIAAADTMEQLYKLLEAELPGTYVIAGFHGGRIRFIPSP